MESRVTIDNRLTFYNHLKNFCKKSANKLNSYKSYLNHNQVRLIYDSSFKGKLSFCPLLWRFCSRRSNHLINKLQERALRIAYNDFNSSFSELLEMANESTIHIRNLKSLLTEVYKSLNGLSPPVMNEYVINTIAFRHPRIWQNIPLEIRNSESLSLLKSNIKKIQSLPFHCKICCSFIAN